MIMITVAFLIGFILCSLFGVPYIDFLKKKTIGQYVKDVAPQNHAKKEGTPTTGGVFIIAAVIMAAVIVLSLAQEMSTTALIALLTLFFYTLAGLQDDYIKIKGHGNDGLTPKGKLLRQMAIALLPTIALVLAYGDNAWIFKIGKYAFNLGWFYPFFAVFVITGSSNAYNLTDGLDGLAAGTGIPAFIAAAVIALLLGETDLAIISASVAGALVGFWEYNKPKAQVFMGDTGSLAIGGLLGTLAILGKFEFFLIFFGAVFVIETLSVIIQVTSFKTTGKRVFKMAPIHHHFELCGWSEKKIVLVFSIVSLLFSVFAVVLFELFAKGIL
ncbi:MAG: phospho-N-acetylmuramoyl-pentapeptide-transferase [Cyanobacteriota bacterium]|nr:phospho-N-acetylmuramoyl-pentapeptide-transferase [Cyanobacteriota bacterium]MDY6364985.1 phospho-N-acetylmuramoyl-pentapeptide-transferase [Cyanobacteriota bacterium]